MAANKLLINIALEGGKEIERQLGDLGKAGETAFKKFNNWLPDDTVEAFREYLVGIKVPLTTPVGGGIRSLNVAVGMAVHWANYFGCSRAMPSLLVSTNRYGAFIFFCGAG